MRGPAPQVWVNGTQFQQRIPHRNPGIVPVVSDLSLVGLDLPPIFAMTMSMRHNRQFRFSRTHNSCEPTPGTGPGVRHRSPPHRGPTRGAISSSRRSRTSRRSSTGSTPALRRPPRPRGSSPPTGTPGRGWATSAAWSSATRSSSRRPGGWPASTPRTTAWSSAGSTCATARRATSDGSACATPNATCCSSTGGHRPRPSSTRRRAQDPAGVVRRRVLQSRSRPGRRRRGRPARPRPRPRRHGGRR